MRSSSESSHGLNCIQAFLCPLLSFRTQTNQFCPGEKGDWPPDGPLHPADLLRLHLLHQPGGHQGRHLDQRLPGDVADWLRKQ